MITNFSAALCTEKIYGDGFGYPRFFISINYNIKKENITMGNNLLSRKKKEAILAEETYFDIPIHLATGTILEETTDGDERIFEGVSSDGIDILATYDEVIILSFNEDVRNRISKFSQFILGIRGVKNVADISVNDPEVKKLLNDKRKENKSLGGSAVLTDQDKISAIQIVKQKHEPHYRAVVFEVILWAMMRNDIFTAQIGKGSKSLDCRFPVNLTDDLFNPEVVQDDLDDIFMGGSIEPIKRDKTQPIEIGIAVAKYLLNENESFAEKAGELAGVVFANMAFLVQEFDDEDAFRESVVEVLSGTLVKPNTSVNGTNLRGGVQFNSPKAGQSREQETKEDAYESN